MDVGAITALVSNLGFPIVCVIGLGWFLYQVFQKTTAQNETNMKAVQERCAAREERLYQQIDKFGESLNSFNATLIRIDARLEVVEEHLKEN